MSFRPLNHARHIANRLAKPAAQAAPARPSVEPDPRDIGGAPGATGSLCAPAPAPLASTAPAPAPAPQPVSEPSVERHGAALEVATADIRDDAAPSHAETPPVYSGFARVLDYGTKPLTGMTVKFALSDPEDPEVHPFKGMRCARHAGHRLRIVVSQPVEGEEDRTLFVGEASLTWWSDDCQNGMRVTIRLDDGGPDAPQRHPLTGLEPGRNGEAVFFACWALDNGEAPEHPRDARNSARKPFVQMTAVQQSNIKCRRDERFQAWCSAEAAGLLPSEARAALPDFGVDPIKFAEATVRAFCGVASRSEFNQDTAAGFAARQRWQEMLRLFEAWRRRTRPAFFPPDGPDSW